MSVTGIELLMRGYQPKKEVVWNEHVELEIINRQSHFELVIIQRGKSKYENKPEKRKLESKEVYPPGRIARFFGCSYLARIDRIKTKFQNKVDQRNASTEFQKEISSLII